MFHFHWPWMLLLILLPALLWLVQRVWRGIWRGVGGKAQERARERARERVQDENSFALLNPSVATMVAAFGDGPGQRPPRRGWQTLFKAVLWIALVGVMMRPQWLEPHSEVITQGYDLMLAVDCSRSMEALDFTVNQKPVSRMAVVKGVLSEFIDQRQGDRMGLVVFGDNAFVQSPLTLDLRAVRNLLEGAVPRMAGDATAIGDAIALSVKKLRERPEASRVLILVTDGENTSGMLPPREAVKLAEHYGVRIYTIGVGSLGEKGDGMVPFMENGKMTLVKMQIDEDLLREIAQRTGGSYQRATDTQALEQITARIAEMERTESETRTRLLPTPLYRWPLAIALVALALLVLTTPRGSRP